MDADAVQKLGRLLGLLGSSFDAEALAAARKANEIVRSSGKSWFDLLSAEPVLPEAAMRKLYDAGFQAGVEHGRAEAEAMAAGPAWQAVDSEDLWGGEDPRRHAPHLAGVIDQLEALWARRVFLSRWEARFVPDIAKKVLRFGQLTPRQVATVEKIYNERV